MSVTIRETITQDLIGVGLTPVQAAQTIACVVDDCPGKLADALDVSIGRVRDKGALNLICALYRYRASLLVGPDHPSWHALRGDPTYQSDMAELAAGLDDLVR